MPRGGKRANSGRKPKAIAPDKVSTEKRIAREKVAVAMKTTDDLKAPSCLSKTAKQEWKRIVKLYRAIEVPILNDLDIVAMAMYCEAWAQWKDYQKRFLEIKIKIEETLKNDPKASVGSLREEASGCQDAMNKQIKVVMSLSEQLCLSPVGRARMGMNPFNKRRENKVVAFLNRK